MPQAETALDTDDAPSALDVLTVESVAVRFGGVAALSDANLTVKAGTKVVFTNADPTGHTVTADDQSFDSQPVVSGATYTTTITKTVSYHCEIHPSMNATIEVGG